MNLFIILLVIGTVFIVIGIFKHNAEGGTPFDTGYSIIVFGIGCILVIISLLFAPVELLEALFG